jgi:hypothetical protein
MLRFFANAFRAILAVALVVLAAALAPTVGKAFAHARTPDGEAALHQPVTESCAAFEAWFLDPACDQAHVKKVAHTKDRLGHN